MVGREAAFSASNLAERVSVHQFAPDLAVELPERSVEFIAAATAKVHCRTGIGRHLRQGQTYARCATNDRNLLVG
jgi:hypothetical protein